MDNLKKIIEQKNLKINLIKNNNIYISYNGSYRDFIKIDFSYLRENNLTKDFNFNFFIHGEGITLEKILNFK